MHAYFELGGSDRDALAGAGTDRLRHGRGDATGSVPERHRFEGRTGIESAPATSLADIDPENRSGDG